MAHVGGFCVRCSAKDQNAGYFDIAQEIVQVRSMTRKKPSGASQKTKSNTRSDPRQKGMRAFSAHDFDAAIEYWSRLNQRDESVNVALAEAYFRRALKQPHGASQVADMRQAHTLMPEDVRYQYHLGLALHRAGDLEAAIAYYHAVLEHSPHWPGVAMVLTLAELQRNPDADLETLPGSSPEIRKKLEPVQTLLRGQTPPMPDSDDEALHMLWHGLGLVRQDGGEAYNVLWHVPVLPSPVATAVRDMYAGVSAARQGDMEAALAHWQQVYAIGILCPPWLVNNLVAALVPYLQAELEHGDARELADLAGWITRAQLSHSALNPLLVQVLDRAAHYAAAEGDWSQAIDHWEAARQIVSNSSGLGSPRLLLHNLALAYEALEEWVGAAEVWRAMLRTRPRKTSKSKQTDSSDGLDYSDEQWAWIRKRVIECYRHAGEPGEAVKVFRQALKSSPDDLDMRIQLADALLANDQDQACINELNRIIERDPQHVEAHLRLADIYGSNGYWGAAEHSLRVVLDQHPEREDVRRQISRLLLTRGNYLHNAGMLDAARRIFEEGQQFAPNDYQFPLNLARIAVDQSKISTAEPLLEQVLELGSDHPRAYIFVIDCWAVANRIDRAREVLTQAQRELAPTTDFYTELALTLLARNSPASPLGGIFGPSPVRQADSDSPWHTLAMEAVQQAIALRPSDPQVRYELATALLPLKPELALQLAEEAVELAPDNPQGLLLVGILQGVNDRNREAKTSLRNAAKMARQQGNSELAEQADMMREQIGSPFFRLSLQMGMMGELDDDIDMYL
jgi:tetratricopeptide (TPR) repeat protein